MVLGKNALISVPLKHKLCLVFFSTSSSFALLRYSVSVFINEY